MLFSAPVMVAFQFSFAVLVRYRTWNVFRIRSRCDPHSDGKSDPSYSGYSPFAFLHFQYGAITLLSAAFQQTSCMQAGRGTSPNTTLECPYSTPSVCPVPFSLAVTGGIAIAFSSCP